MNKNTRLAVIATALATCLVATAGAAGSRSASGTYSGLAWTASSMVTGTTNTLVPPPGGLANGGDPIYWPVYPRDSGIVYLLMNTTKGGFICSGSLLNDGMSILTAGHCVSDGFNTANPISTTVFFQPPGGLGAGTRIESSGLPNGGAETRQVGQYFVNPGYTGNVIDHNDVAVLRLTAPAPAHATSYGLYTTNDLTGQNFTFNGYGRLGDGATGNNNFTSRLRNGDNKYDYALGNAAFGTNWAAALGEPFAQIQHSTISDFDNGLAANDTTCTVSQDASLAGAAGAVFCDLGRGAREAGVSGGDSGGPSFINGMISSITSYGLSFGPEFGDVGPACLPDPAPSCVNSSFGEFSGYVPVWLHADFINAAMVPEPGTYALMGLGLVGVAGLARRRRRQQS